MYIPILWFDLEDDLDDIDEEEEDKIKYWLGDDEELDTLDDEGD